MTDKNLTLAYLKDLRAAGVKSATFEPDGELVSVEFFPRSILDVSAFTDGAAADETDTERPPPPRAEERPMAVAPAFQRILGKGSVS